MSSQLALDAVHQLASGRPVLQQEVMESIAADSASAAAIPPSSDAEARPLSPEHREMPHAEEVHAHAFGNLFGDDDSDSSTTGSMSQPPAPVAELDSDATLSDDEDGWVPEARPGSERDRADSIYLHESLRPDSMPAMLPADERAAEAAALSADESDDGTLSFMSDGSMPALVPADSRRRLGFRVSFRVRVIERARFRVSQI